jgi:cyclophilin family peptidyl-prolyl cis-trans isomerase
VIHTSLGDIDIELWPKEAPKAVRNFLQLALDTYYDGLEFHRVIKGLFVQTGASAKSPSDTIYGPHFNDEFHQRLRFNHRGLLACANDNLPNSNTNQFFITLDKCPWLDGKHTIFGRVSGDSIFNVLRIGEVETDKFDKPLEPPVILSINVLENPFPDVIPRTKAQKTETHVPASRKGVLSSSLLSFEDSEDVGSSISVVKSKMKAPSVNHDGSNLLETKAPEAVDFASQMKAKMLAKRNRVTSSSSHSPVSHQETFKEETSESPIEKQNTSSSSQKVFLSNKDRIKMGLDANREELTMKKLFSFQSKIRHVAHEVPAPWMEPLRFTKHIDDDFRQTLRDENVDDENRMKKQRMM